MKNLKFVCGTSLNNFVLDQQGADVDKSWNGESRPRIEKPADYEATTGALYLNGEDLARVNEELAAATRFDIMIGDGGTPFLVDDQVLMLAGARCGAKPSLTKLIKLV